MDLKSHGLPLASEDDKTLDYGTRGFPVSMAIPAHKHTRAARSAFLRTASGIQRILVASPLGAHMPRRTARWRTAQRQIHMLSLPMSALVRVLTFFLPIVAGPFFFSAYSVLIHVTFSLHQLLRGHRLTCSGGSLLRSWRDFQGLPSQFSYSK